MSQRIMHEKEKSPSTHKQIGAFRAASTILQQEPEEWLAYLYGQKLDELESYRTTKKPRFRGAILRSLAFFKTLGRYLATSISRQGSKVTASTYFFYSGSENQSSALQSSVSALAKYGEPIFACTFEKQLAEATASRWLHILPVTFRDTSIATILFMLKAPALYKRLKKRDPELTHYFFSFFINAYFYLAVFYRVLSQSRPEFVIVSNDHNVDCRSLIAVARFLGIKTVYMQHASVSNVFPALTVDFAFLDGQSALETYQHCENNLPPQTGKRHFPWVLLSGQKKPLEVDRATKESRVGVAANMLDNPALIADLVDYLVSRELPVSLRWHPRQSDADIALFQERFGSDSRVHLSVPGNQSIADYLGGVQYLISGNSSIHLEAAIAGITPIYHEVQTPYIEDYYGYAQHGLAKRLDSGESIVEFIRGSTNGPDPLAVRFYSATYGTQWHGKEGELVAHSLKAINDGEPVPSLWGYAPYNTHSDQPEATSKTLP